MGYSMEVMQRARARLAAAKADRESENQQHLQDAYARLPRLKEIDRQLRIQMGFRSVLKARLEEKATAARIEQAIRSWLQENMPISARELARFIHKMLSEDLIAMLRKE